jgi:hypothetical protein
LLPPVSDPAFFARDVVVLRLAAGRDALDAVPELLALVPVDRDAVDLERAPPVFAADLRVADPDPLERLPDDEPRAAPPPVSLPLSSLHLPDITRWAASATASAISEPSRVALVIMELAALLALSAASIPASRIARRALGLAAIAAAAAVRPAASISLLIAALVILSMVESDEERAVERVPDDFVLEDFLVVLRFAIGYSSLESRKRHFRTETVPASPFDAPADNLRIC